MYAWGVGTCALSRDHTCSGMRVRRVPTVFVCAHLSLAKALRPLDNGQQLLRDWSMASGWQLRLTRS